MLQDLAELNVHVVDDDPFQLRLIALLLAQQGVNDGKIHKYLSGGEALTFLGGCHTEKHLVMLDLNMPDMDGVEVVRLLAERSYAGALCLVSGEDKRILDATEKLARARSLNILGSLDKPIQREALEGLLGIWSRQVEPSARQGKKLYPAEELQRALTCGELLNMYQPKVNVRTGKVSGVESLVRWRHPSDGMVYPDQFICVAEEYGLIDDLTRVVLREALDQARVWAQQGLSLRVAVNVSMDNLTKLDFADYVMQELARTEVQAQGLILEVTESRLMKDTISPLDILARLRLKQVSLSIDDFGTGHSSLAQLRDFPFDELKVDRSFVHGAATNAIMGGIFEGSLQIARQLGMTVVAEGVEDRVDWEYLRTSGADLAQGYFIARPMMAEAVGDWCAGWHANVAEYIA